MPGQHHPLPLREIGLLFVLGALWGIPFALTKVSLESIPPVTLTAARVSLAAATLWAVVFFLKREVPARPGFFVRLLLQGTVGCAIPYMFIAWGQRSVESGLAAILNSSTPLFVYLISALWTHHESTTIGRLAGAVIGLGGVVLVVGANTLFFARGELIGQAAILLATLSSAISVIHGRRFTGIAAEVVAAGTLTGAALMLVPLSLLVDVPWHLAPTGRSLAALIVNAIVVTAIGFVLYFRLIRTIGSMSTASTSYLKPAVSVLIGCTLLGEPFTPTLALGLAAVLFGIAVINERTTLAVLSRILGYCRQSLPHRLPRPLSIAAPRRIRSDASLP